MKILLSVISILCVLSSTLVAAEEASCQEQNIKLQVLGSGGPELDDQRASSSYLIWRDDKAVVLVDAGAGSAFNFERSTARIEDLQAILLTHLHVDHSVDLPSYIKASYFTGRDKDLPVFGPGANALMPATSAFVSRLMGSQGAYQYLKDYVNKSEENDFHLQTHDVVVEGSEIYVSQLSQDIRISAIDVHHGPVAAIAWRVDMENCSISFSGDMNNRYQNLSVLAKGSDILVMHNAIPESAGGVAAQLHMKPSQIGEIAQQSQVDHVVLSHFMKRTLGRESQTLSTIRESYTGQLNFADDLAVFSVGMSSQ